MKRTALALTLVLALFLSAVAGTHFVKLGRANPINYVYRGEVSPDADTKPPTISIPSPENNTSYATNSVSLTLSVSVENSGWTPSRFIQEIYCKTDWQPNSYVYAYNASPYSPYTYWILYENSAKTEFSTIVNLTAVPEGKHSIVVYANEVGKHHENDKSYLPFIVGYYLFHINSSATVFFYHRHSSAKRFSFVCGK